MKSRQEAERTIYLVNPQSPDRRLRFWNQYLGLPVAYGFVGSMAERVRDKEGFKNEVDVKFVNEDMNKITEVRPGDLVFLSSFSFTANSSRTVVHKVTEKGAYAPVGGVHATLAPNDFTSVGGISFMGEAGNSEVFSRLMEQWLHTGALDRGTIFKSEGLDNPRAIDLAGLPVSEDVYKQLDKNMIVRGTTAVIGCPFNCDFCTVMNGRIVRTRPVEEVVAELKLRGLDKTGFTLYDSNLGAAPEDYLYNLLEAFAKMEIPRGWSTEISIDLLDKGGDKLLDALKASHCHRLFVGIESPNTNNLESVGKKHNLKYNTEKVKEIVRKTHERGIKITGLYIVGFPEETIESIGEIEEHINDTEMDDANIFILTPLPETKIRSKLIADGSFDPKDLNTDDLDLRHLVFNHKLGNDVILREYAELCNRVFSWPAIISRSKRAFFMSRGQHLPAELRQQILSSIGTEIIQMDSHRKLGLIDQANKVYDIWQKLSRRGT